MIPVSGLLARLLLIAASAFPLVPALAANQTRIAGREYVRLTDWAKEHDFSIQWLKRDEIVQFVNATTKLRFEVHSPEAQINGVAVRLLFPLAAHTDGIYISHLDLQTTFVPVLAPSRSHGKGTIKNICLDPGHGGKDPGFRVGSNQEKRYTLLLAQELKDQLTQAGYHVSLTRTRDTFLELPDRPEIAKRRKSDLFISLHFNAAETSTSSVQGTEVYCFTPAGAPSTNAHGEGGGAGWFTGNRFNDQNMLLAYELQKSLTHMLPAEDRGVHRARFAVLRDAEMPAVLIEAGFMSHPVEGHKIFTASYRRQIARAVVEGISSYKTAMGQ